MSSQRPARKRRPGRPIVHGARQQLAAQQLARKVDHRRETTRTHDGIAFTLATRLVPWTVQDDARLEAVSTRTPQRMALEIVLGKLDAVQRARVDAAADVGAVYLTLKAWVFRQPGFVGADGELLPALRKSFLGYGNAWRRELKDFDLEPEDIDEPSLSAYLAARSTNGSSTTDSPAPQPEPESVADQRQEGGA